MKLLIFQHVPHEHPGYITDYAAKNNIELTVIELWKKYTLPDYKNFDGLIIMGGPMGVYENEEKFPSKLDEVNYIKNAIDKIPVIGFCLGSQLLAYALGGKVAPNFIDGKIRKEIGYYDIELTGEGQVDHIFRDFSSPLKVLQWHGDTFSLPENAVLLATSPDCKNQAFRFGVMAYGTLFHFEFTPEMVSRQNEIDKDWINKDFSFDKNQVIAQSKDYKILMEKQCEIIMNNFLSLTKNGK